MRFNIFILSSISSFEINDAVIPDPWMFFWKAASVADIAADNPNGNKRLLARGVSKLFIYGKPAAINGLRKLRNPSSWLVRFLVVPFSKFFLFSKDLITSIISFISMFVQWFHNLLFHQLILQINLLTVFLIVLFYEIEFLKILYYLMNHLQKLYKFLKLVYQLIIICVEN